MKKTVSAGIGVGIGLIALAIIFLASGETDLSQSESPMAVELSDEIEVVVDETKSYEVGISEGLEVGDGSP